MLNRKICFLLFLLIGMSWDTAIANGEKEAYFPNKITGEELKSKYWRRSGRCSFEKAYDGKYSLAIDSRKTKGKYYKWITKIKNVRPNTSYRLYFDRMYDSLSPGMIGGHFLGREFRIPTSAQARIWDRFSLEMNSGTLSGDVEFDIFHYLDDRKTWVRNFNIELIEATPISPVNSKARTITVLHKNPILCWSKMDDASFVVQLSQGKSFPKKSTIISPVILDTNNWQVRPNLTSGLWYWRVAVASAALVNLNKAEYSAPASFFVSKNATVAALKKSALKLTPVKSPTKIIVDKQGRILVNNKPIFVIGLYAVIESRKNMVNGTYMTPANVALCEPLFKELKEAGFNTIQNYGTASGQMVAVENYLDLADKYNLMVLMQLSGVRGMHKDALENQIRAFSHHPSIISWLLVDEGDMSGWSPVKARLMYNFMKELDPSRLVGMVVTACSHYADAVDLLLPDPYTLRSGFVPQYDFFKNLKVDQESADTASTPTTVVSILQAFKYEDEYNKAEKSRGRVPSFEEERCISYLSIAAGNQGVMFYAYHSSSSYLKEYPEHWKDMKRIAGELRDRSKIFLGDEVLSTIDAKGKGLVYFTRKYKDVEYLFVINPDVKPKNLKLLIPEKIQKVTLLESGEELKLKSSRIFTRKVEKYEVLTFKVEK